jgi:hypothetical protein
MPERLVIRPVTGRERRQDDRTWAERHAAMGVHDPHDWCGQMLAIDPDQHIATMAYSCCDCETPIAVRLECQRRVCSDCYPEGLAERAKHWTRMSRSV